MPSKTKNDSLSADQIDAVDRLLKYAFEQETEASLVKTLRGKGALITEHIMPLKSQSQPGSAPTEMAGYIAYSGLTFETGSSSAVWGLAPMAISPALQGQGTGLSFLQHSLQRCLSQGCTAVILLGHVNFYQKAGFTPAADYGLRFCDDAAINSHFMALELVDDALKNISGLVSYDDAFYSL